MTGSSDTQVSDTPLGLWLKDRIKKHGSVTVEYFMEQCLHHEVHGYYRRGSMLGAKGDFVTSPDISQVFGELIGLWAAVVWQQMGRPEVVHLLELGPGRGTLMADALRAAKVAPGFSEAVRVHLVEISEPLQDAQRGLLAAQPRLSVGSKWQQPHELERGGLIVIGNEFLDTLPVEQWVFHDGAWRLRHVGLDADDRFRFQPTAGAFASLGNDLPLPHEGDVFESAGLVYDLGVFLDRFLEDGWPVAALFIDYGHGTPGYGDTLQGVKAHRYVSPFETPGETDLTTQVDFTTVARAFGTPRGFITEPLVTQAEFLGALGIIERASKLMSSNPARAAEIEAGVARLIAPNGMGTRFRVFGARGPGLPPLPGFPVVASGIREA